MWTIVSLFFGGSKGAIVAVLLGVVVLAAGGWLVANAFHIAGLERDVARAEKATAKAREDLAVVTTNRDNLKASLEKQNASIEQLQQSNAALTIEANLHAALLLASTKAATDKIRRAPPANIEDLNAWFRARFQ